ncbi:MAG: DNA mismatch repair endonuclease MutL [Myxococcota bacterium]
MSSHKKAAEIRPARVRRLPEGLIDQIAAGEVVERPSSVVKELVENALDAGSRRLRVEVRAGGRDWIAVTDDGQGMTADDARLALERHATSKIASADDLDRIQTYGFRGEALPAIASVSRLRLRTRARGAPEAFALRAEGGRVLPGQACGGPEGTRVEVADLFAAVPARRKFLKSVTTEWGHIADGLGRTALARPDVHFDLCRDDRPSLTWPAATDPLDRVAAVLGEEEAAGFSPVAREEGRAALSGFVSRPDRHRASMAGIRLFVNRRPVRDRLLQHALVEVYRDLLPRGRFPSALLFLEVPPGAVDVNVHPAKWEVRFADPRWVHRLVREGVREAIAERRWIAPAPTSGAGRTDWVFAGGAGGASPAPAAAGGPRQSFQTAAPGFEAPAAGARFADLRLLGQFLATYLVLETKERLLLVDQHAAHERVLFERLRAEWVERGVESQRLLIPATVPLEPAGLAALTDCADALARLGFELEAFGEATALVRGVPALLAQRDPASLVRSLADELRAAEGAGDPARPGSRAIEAADRIFATLACHSARRKGELLDPREQQALLDALDAIPWAPTCPHGRPVAVPIELAEIERRFGRR